MNSLARFTFKALPKDQPGSFPSVSNFSIRFPKRHDSPRNAEIKPRPDVSAIDTIEPLGAETFQTQAYHEEVEEIADPTSDLKSFMSRSGIRKFPSGDRETFKISEYDSLISYDVGSTQLAKQSTFRAPSQSVSDHMCLSRMQGAMVNDTYQTYRASMTSAKPRGSLSKPNTRGRGYRLLSDIDSTSIVTPGTYYSPRATRRSMNSSTSFMAVSPSFRTSEVIDHELEEIRHKYPMYTIAEEC